MHGKSSKAVEIIGYGLLVAVFILSASIYVPSLMIFGFDEILRLSALIGALAIIDMTVSIFWLWKPERVTFIEQCLGPAGHVLHCGYCLALWLALLATTFFGFSLFGFWGAPRVVDFLLSWWAVGFMTVVCYEFVVNLWFIKLQQEFSIRERYEAKQLK